MSPILSSLGRTHYCVFKLNYMLYKCKHFPLHWPETTHRTLAAMFYRIIQETSNAFGFPDFSTAWRNPMVTNSYNCKIHRSHIPASLCHFFSFQGICWSLPGSQGTKHVHLWSTCNRLLAAGSHGSMLTLLWGIKTENSD